MNIKPGYQTSEHALAWAVLVLGLVAVIRGSGAMEHLVAVVGPAVASAAYSQSRGRAKAAAPFVLATTGARTQGAPAPGALTPGALAQQLGALFRGRVVG
jgi:hypothetical protein